jgi:hypothetical protein
MADAHAPSKALLPFLRARNLQRTAEVRQSDLIAEFALDAEARFGRLNRLPAAAQFAPFETLSTRGDADAAHTDSPPYQGAGTRPRRASDVPVPSGGGRRPAQPATLLSAYGPTHSPNVSGITHETPDRVRGSAEKHLTTRITALDPRPATGRLINTDDPTFAHTRPTGREPSQHMAHTLRADIARNAGELIGELLQRHPAPRQPARLQGIGARPAATSALPVNGDTPAGQRTAAPGAAIATSPDSRLQARMRSTPPGRTYDTVARAPDGEHTGTSFSRCASAGLVPSEPTPARDAAAPAPAHLPSGGDTLRALVTPLFLRPAPGVAPAAAEQGPGTQHRIDRPTVLRAPSRLLGAAAPGNGSAATRPVVTQANGAAQAPTTTIPADTSADLATGLDRLLREQAWLRGVDLT